MKQVLVALRALVFASAFVLLWAWVASALRFRDASLGGPLPASTRPLGWALMILGAVVACWCVAAFVVQGRGTPAPFDPPRLLVARGPYRFIRNPMYVGAGLVLAGFGLQQRSPSIVLFLPVWALLVQLMVVLYEEPSLRRRFGRAYEEYCRRTRRWLPRLGGRAGAGSLALLVVLGPMQTGSGQKPNFSGEWKLNPARSDFGPLNGPDSQTDRIDHSDPALHIQSRRRHGDRESAGEWECQTDGGPCTVSVVGTRLELASAARWDGGVLVFESHGTYDGRQVRMLDRWSLSPDGTTLTIVRRLSNQLGEAHQTIVLEKQE